MNPTLALMTAQAQHVLRAIRRHRRLAIRFFVVVMAAVILVTLFMPRTYQSEGKLFVRLGRENATLDATASLGQDPVVAVPYSRDNDINSVAEILQSRALLEKVVDAIGPAVVLGKVDLSAEISPSAEPTDAATRDRAIRKLATDLKVAVIRRSNIVQISCLAGSPELAQKILAKHLDLFQQEYIRLNRPPEVHEFFVKQTERLHQELTAKEEQLRDLKTSTGLSSLPEQRRAIVDRVSRLENDLLDVQSSRAAAESRVQMLKKQLAELPATNLASRTAGIGNEGTDRMRDQFYALQLRKEEAAAKFTEDHPAMQRINQQVAEAQKLVGREETTRTQMTTAINRPHEESQIALLKEEPILAALQARADALRTQLADVRKELKAFNEQELQIAQLGREVDLLTANYRKYSANLEQTRVDQALEARQMSNIGVVQPATFETRPISPRKTINLALGLFVALFGGVGLALLKESLDPLVRASKNNGTPTEARVLGAVPYLPMRQATVQATVPSNGNGNG